MESASGPLTAPGGDQALSLDVIFDMLSVERRRRVLRYLLTESEATTLSDLAEHIAAIENDKPEAALSSDERKRVYVGLYQCHLPRMADASVIDYESDRGTVELGPTADAVTAYLPAEEESDGPAGHRQWPIYYLSLAFAGAGLFVGQNLLYPTALLAGFSIGLIVSTFCLVALLHARSAGRLSLDFGVLHLSPEERLS